MATDSKNHPEAGHEQNPQDCDDKAADDSVRIQLFDEENIKVGYLDPSGSCA